MTWSSTRSRIYAACLGVCVLAGASILDHGLGIWIGASLLPALFILWRFGDTAKDPASIHRRMIDVLALTMEAKDHVTHAHLKRVEVYALAIGQELGLHDDDLDALRASALLHDIGKLAVPEYIISKPGKLTPAEFERMKVHTVVGAEIVEQMRLPYPATPIVRSHHERWDGKGYPDGLSGEQIPIGARILSAVDCLDALISDRQYRRALPLDQAIAILESEAGKAFDPRVVAILIRRHLELERLATSGEGHQEVRLSTDLKIVRGEAPAAGFESCAINRDLINFHKAMAAEDLIPGCMDRRGALSTFLASVGSIVPFDAIALYRKRGDRLILEGQDGEGYRTFVSRTVPAGVGLSGWVAENARSIVNGNPAVEPGYLADPLKFSALRSALSVPLEAGGSVVGVLSLYRREFEAFTTEDLERIRSIASVAAKAFNLTAPAQMHHTA